MDFERLTRVIDLFTEGTEVYLGDDPETSAPVLIWVNKLNAFEVEEARTDGRVRRSERMSQLGADDSPERMGMEAELKFISTPDLAKTLVDLKGGELYLDIMNDVETDPEMREIVERSQRLPQLLDDEGAAPDDPRRTQLLADQARYFDELEKRVEKATSDAVQDAMELDRADLERAFFEQWRERETTDVFMAEQRITQLYLAMRECSATDVSTTADVRKWDHSSCDHSKRLMAERQLVRRLPDEVTRKVAAAIEELRVSVRQAGKSDAPPSSSGSSEH